jgi:hypothetical protein
MIRLNDNDSAVLAMIAQYVKVPAFRKERLVSQLSTEARPIGMVLIGKKSADASAETLETAEQFKNWTQRNKSNRAPGRSRRRTVLGGPALKKAPTLEVRTA